jgi:hypothetical protein
MKGQKGLWLLVVSIGAGLMSSDESNTTGNTPVFNQTARSLSGNHPPLKLSFLRRP